MTIYIGADHGGFSYKQQLVEQLRSRNYEVVDVGANHLDPLDDYPVYGRIVAESVAAQPQSRGLALCRSGHGMVMAANKVPGVRAILATDDVAWTTQSVEHDNANVLAIGVDYIDTRQLIDTIEAWLTATYEGGKHQRRLDQIADLEKAARIKS